VKRALKTGLMGVLAMGVGLAVIGCKSAPPLTQADAQKMIQAYYDQQAPAPVHIYVDYTGLKQGTDAKYWKVVKVFPANKYWGDLDLTDEGKKVLKLEDGSNTIQWRPDDQNKGHFYINTVQTTHPRIIEVGDPQDDIIPGVDTAKSAQFTVSTNLEGLPDTVKQMAHNVGNILTDRHTAEFALVNGAWTVHDIQ
jgi:hypothetical protein